MKTVNFDKMFKVCLQNLDKFNEEQLRKSDEFAGELRVIQLRESIKNERANNSRNR